MSDDRLLGLVDHLNFKDEEKFTDFDESFNSYFSKPPNFDSDLQKIKSEIEPLNLGSLNLKDLKVVVQSSI